MSARPLPAESGPLWAQRLLRPLARIVWSIRVEGAEHVPATGPVILAANHLGVMDGPIVLLMAPRGSHFLVKAEVFRGLVGRILRWSGQIPVDRASGRAGLETARGVLKQGGAVGIFPEGNRGRGDGVSVRAGVAWLAVQGSAPVVPVAVLGTRRTGEPMGHVPGFRRRLVVEFGAPVAPQPADSARESLRLTADLVAVSLATHVSGSALRHGVELPGDGPTPTV